MTPDQALAIALEHERAGRLADAEALYRQVLAHRPDTATALNNLGNVLQQTGRREEAIDAYRRAIAMAPFSALAHYNLASALICAGAFDEALQALDSAMLVRPDDADIHNNRGGVLQRLGRLEEAIAAYQQALAIRGGHVAAASNLGSALSAAGRLDEAIAILDAAVAVEPDNAAAHANRGIALHAAGRLDAAIAAFSRAITLAPGDAEAHANLGRALNDAGRPDLAEDVLRLGLRREPGNARLHDALGNVLKDQGRLDLAIGCYERALELAPDDSTAASNRLFALHLDPDHDAARLLAEHRRWADRFAAPLAAEIRPHDLDRAPDRRLKVGFVSADFRGHPVGRLLLPLFTHRDRERFAFVAYADVRVADPVTREFHELADRWRPIAGLSDSAVAGLVREEQIDILVDLAQHTEGNRLLVFARKPAPVQVSMLGMPATTGLATIDYRFTDRYLDPPGTGDLPYTERSIRLPSCFWCYRPDVEAPPVGLHPSLATGRVTLGCLNQSAKLTPPALALWIKVLQAVDDADLVLHSSSGRQRDAIRAQFKSGGIAPDRVTFLPRLPLARYLEAYGTLDLALDPFPYSGGTTTLDALWMDVPVVTLAGQTAVGRGGVSILSNLGLPELIGRTDGDYVAIAVALARDRDRLAALRAGLRQRMQASPLVDARQYATGIEAALRSIWRTWCGS
jgi:predicted O-linked N-acetylglucosamine transferase (SPINDLY family)